MENCVSSQGLHFLFCISNRHLFDDLLHVGFHLVAIWSEKVVESSLEMAEMENASPHEAEKWILTPNLSQNL